MGSQKPVIRIGISRCLLGEEVRFDGGHKHDPFITGTLSKYFQWVPVCPEVEAGLGIPRESVRLVRVADEVRMRGVRTGNDVTDVMQSHSKKRIQELSESELHGYLLKKDSPSCGMERVKIFNSSGISRREGRGLFAELLMRQFPLLPVEEEGRLHDLLIRENFIERVFCYYRWIEFLKHHPKPRDLVSFHSKHKLTILSHSTEHYRALGRLVASSPDKKWDAGFVATYGNGLFEALKKKATPSKHSNVLYHLLGYLKKWIDAQDKAEAIDCIERYRKGLLPLIVPMTLLIHHFRRFPDPWVMEQTYLNPYPAELMLRNHV